MIMTASNPSHDKSHSARIAKAFAKDSLPGELQDFGPAAREAAASFMLGALARRPSGTTSIAIDTLVNDHGQRQMRLAVINADMPFLVDSVAAVVAAHGVVIDRLLHPIMAVARDETGALIDIAAAPFKASQPESLIYLETERVDAKARAEIRDLITANMVDVRHAVSDWPALTQALAADASAMADAGEAELLDWFAANRFTLLGHAEYAAKGSISKPLGLARTRGESLLSKAARSRAIEWFTSGHGNLLIVKSNFHSTVHRRVPLDLIIVPRRRGDSVTGLSIHAGLWTSAALSAPLQDVPLLRDRLAGLQAKFAFDPASHAGKALGHALASLPHDILISISADDLETLTLTAMSIADRPRPRLELVAAPLDRHLFAFVWLPRDELTTARRLAIGTMLAEAASAQLLSWSIELGDGEVALLRYTLDLREGGTIPATVRLNQRIEAMVRGWQPAVEASLAAIGDRGQAARLALRYANAFPMVYRSGAGPDEAALDIVGLHALASDRSRNVRFYRNADDAATTLRMKLYSLGAIALSDAVPALENFGFRVLEELSTPVGGGSHGHIQKFVLELPSGRDAAVVAAAPGTLQRAIARVLEGVAEDDRFNQLVLELGLDLGEVTIFRALFRYLRQTGLAYGQVTVVDALRGAPGVAHALIGLFNALHNPAEARGAEKAVQDADQAILRGLANVKGIDEDRILRLYRAVAKATLRTNAFTMAAREALAFKIDSALVPGLPAPKPWREIFVYSPRVEGIHLRAGPVARGGLRWSDRRDDFRTEILGLMKAQRVKNAVIVPTGAKGGFYPKALPDSSNREAWLAEGTECYRIFIRTLLSVTDNIVDGKVVHPEGVVIHDDADPYFVVAADKGTATFSDVANAIALDRGFWLGDAFASGGSVGYDHKAMGITAKGAWVSVQRHFAESGIDVQSEPVRVVGCGDMSGDVFGNGMLLSRAIKLVAAFDHRHIFFDPDPDAARSWQERERMFALPRSSWDDYDKSLISKGGGVFARSAKSIALSKQMRDLLGVSDATMEPSALIAAILRSPVDLIWFGGIGTYVKARGESHGDVGDRANDAHRINADELRAKVIGEGANLGVTQAARIEFALRGGRVNTDFIDNSAGVDCSDNEVNIKIGLGADVARGALTMPQRDRLLASMADDVSALVLEDNRLQTLALSIAERGGARALPLLTRLIETFESEGRLDRAVEGLAANDELVRRAQSGQGLTRPELSVLLATAKLWLQDAIEAVDTQDDALLDAGLLAAFPPAIRKKHAQAISGHQLRAQIIATKLANRIVNRMGLIHPLELAEEEGASLGEVALAFVAAEALHDAPRIWKAIEEAKVSESARLLLFEQLAIELRVQMADLLRNGWAGAKPATVVAALTPGLGKLRAKVEDLLLGETRRHAEGFALRLAEAGAPKAIIADIVGMAKLDGTLGVATLARRIKVDELALARGFTTLGAALGLDWAQGAAMQLSPSDPWERLLAAGLARDFQTMRLDFLARLGAQDPEAQVKQWLAGKADPVRRFHDMTVRAQQGGVASTAMLAQIAGQARQLLA